MLENFNLHSIRNVPRKHLVVEAMRRAYRGRVVYLGDPGFYEVPVERLLDKNYLNSSAINIGRQRVTPSLELSDIPGITQAGMQTTHFSVMGAEVNRVAATLKHKSINLMFGSGFVSKGTGILLNNEMDDFSGKENTSNSHGLVGYKAMLPSPGSDRCQV